jgi:hypothetical protein
VIRRLLLLIGGIVGLWLLLSIPAHLLDEEHGLLFSAVAAGLCLLPTAATLVWCDLVLHASPEQQLTAVFGGTGLRLLFVVGAGLVLYLTREEFRLGRFWVWIVVFYLATLTLEMVLVARRQAEMDKATGVRNPPG